MEDCRRHSWHASWLKSLWLNMSAQHYITQCLWRSSSPFIYLEQLQISQSVVLKSSLWPWAGFSSVIMHSLCVIGRLGQCPGARLSAVAYKSIFYSNREFRDNLSSFCCTGHLSGSSENFEVHLCITQILSSRRCLPHSEDPASQQLCSLSLFDLLLFLSSSCLSSP